MTEAKEKSHRMSSTDMAASRNRRAQSIQESSRGLISAPLRPSLCFLRAGQRSNKPTGPSGRAP
uniref:Uncharacterized protein n=1 Tax=Arundo donax TaxID=35708 RepID=A0A0A9ES51_ARUDO